MLKDNLAFPNEISDNIPLRVKLGQRLLLSLNQLINILNTRRSNISGGGQHDAIKELDMWLQFITIGITLPVQVNHDRCFLNSWYEFFMLLDQKKTEGDKLD